MKISLFRDDFSNPDGPVYKALIKSEGYQDTAVQITKEGKTFVQLSLFESASPQDVRKYLANLGLMLVQQFAEKEHT
jgi:hypothetical protein